MAEGSDREGEGGYWLASPRRIAHDWKLVLGVAAALLVLYLPGLGSYGLYDPWETHYGEVARNMVETDNYIDPWWGSPWDTSGVKREREGFYSKPVLIMWMMAAGMNLFGYTELGVRFFFPLVMLLALLAIYLAVSRFGNRRTGLLATAICATAPFTAFLSRQAVTDGPMVSIMTAGMMALGIGLFHARDEEEASPALYGFTLGLLLLVALGQLWTIWPMDRSPDVVRAYPGSGGFFFRVQWWFQEVFLVGKGKGWALVMLLAPVVAWAGVRVARERRRRMLYVYLFYIACGLCVPAKGWLAWAPMGGAIVGYLIVTGEWKILRHVDIPGGLLIVFVAGHPWCIAMLGGHHPEWYKRFWVHDHYNRLFSGVHSTDDGAFEYFFKWIGYGLFPWIGALPAAIARALVHLRRPVEGYSPSQKFQLFVFLWVLFSFFLFSKSSTKFHHYIFPIIPGLAILIAFFLEDVLQNVARSRLLLMLSSAGVVLWVGQDLWRYPAGFGQSSQNLVNLFTYKYDREWPAFTGAEALEKLVGSAQTDALADNLWLMNFRDSLGGVMLVAVAGFLLMAFFRDWKLRYGAAVLSVAGGWMGWFSLHDFLPKVAVHWSQKEMWDIYYGDCTPYGPDERAEYERFMILQPSRVPSKPEMFPRVQCKEPIVAFRTNWRGETFYSANTVMPAPETKHLKPFLDGWGNDQPFYLFTERSRVKSELEPNLPAHLKGKGREVFGHNLKFVLLRFDPEPPEKRTQGEATGDAPAGAPQVAPGSID